MSVDKECKWQTTNMNKNPEVNKESSYPVEDSQSN